MNEEQELMRSPLRILHLEDDPLDAELVQSMLSEEGLACDVTCVDRREDFVSALDGGEYDVILADYALPSFDGLAALALAQEKCPQIPLILLSGTLGEELAIEALKSGATDYVLKQRLSRLVPCVRRALQEAEGRAERERAEEAIVQAKEAWEHTFDAVPDLIALIDENYQITRVNKAMAGRLGKSPQEAVGLTCYESIHGSKEPPPFCPHARMLADGCEHVEEVHEERLGGRFLVSVSPVHNGGISSMGSVHVARDITEHKRAEQALRESEERYRRITEAVTDYIYTVRVEDGQPVQTIHGPACVAVTGYDPQEFAADPGLWIRMVPEDDRTAVVEHASAALSGQQPAPLEHRIVRKDGSERWVRNTTVPHRDGEGQLLSYDGLIHDVTEQRHAQQERQALLRLHESTVSTIPSSLLVLDADLNVLMANRRYLRGRGIESSDVVGKNISAVFPSSLQAEQSLMDRMAAVARKGGEDDLLGVRHTSSDHEEKDLNIRICGIHSPEERDHGPRVLLVLEDVTVQRQLEAQLRQAGKMETVGRLAGGVAHDFNNMLTGIKGYAQLLLPEMPEGSSAYEDLTQIQALTDRAAALTRQLLAFSRKQALELAVLDLNNVVANATKMLRRLIGEDVDLVSVPGSELGSVYADPGQIEQVLMNLAVNARDAMPNGGKLTIETANVVLDGDYVKTHPGAKPGSHVMIAVTDTGHGMDDEVLGHIFEPFFSTKEEGKGTGLGLATVYGIVKQHGGNVWVYSEPRRGTTFKIYLPHHGEEAQEVVVPLAAGPLLGGTETILVVEDEEAVRVVAQRVLEEQGYTIFCAADPQEAEALFARHGAEVSILVTDVVLPGPSGRELYERLVVDKPELKVLYMSGYTDNAIVHHGVLDAGTPFIQKPFDPASLVRKVREVLDGGESTDQSPESEDRRLEIEE